MSERGYSVKLSANTSAYVAAMKQAETSTSGFASRSKSSLDELGGKMQAVGGTMSRGLTLPLAAAAGVAIHSAATFDTAFAQMVGLAGVAADEIDGLKESVLDLAGRTAVAPQELADALYQAASSGLDTAAAMKAVEVAAVASAAGMGTASDVVGLVSSAVNSYGEANITAAEATDILTATIREGRADPDELAGSLGRVLPIAAAMGVSFEEVGGTVAYLSNIFGDTDRTVTAVNDAMAKLSAPTDGARDALEAAGTSADELQSTIRDDGLLAGLELLRDHGFAGNAAAIRELMPDMQGAVALTALLNDESGTLTSTLEGVANNTGATGEAFDAVASGPGFAMKQAVTDMKVALIQAGDVIMPIVSGIAGGIGDMASAFSKLPGPAQAVVVGFLAILAATGPLLTVGGKIVSNLGSLKSGFEKLKGASMGASIGLGAVGVAAAAGYVIYSEYNKAKQLAKQRTEDFTAALKAEKDGQEGATEAVLAATFAQGEYADAMDDTGLTAADLASFVTGDMTPAMAAYSTSIDASSVGGKLLIESLKDQRAAFEEAQRYTAAEKDALDALTPATEAATAATEDAAIANFNLVEKYDAGTRALTFMEVATDAKAQADEDAAAAAEEHTQALRDQAEAYVDNFAAANEWLGGIGSAMESAGGAISDFSDEALTDIDTFQQELADNIEALYGWQNNIITIAGETSPEFATYLADMGLAGADLVADLAATPDELQATFDLWTVGSAVAGRDMVGEFAKVSPDVMAEFEKLGRDVASTVEGIGPLSATEAQSVGAAIAAGIAAGIDINAGFIAASVAAAAHFAIARSKEAIEAGSPSRLFAREIGAPIAWGIVAGMDENQEKVIDAAKRLVEGLEKGIESSKKDALDAVDDMVDEIADRFDDMWDVVEGRRDLEGLTEGVADAERDLADVMADPERTTEQMTAAREKLEDANYRLLKASQDLLDQGPAGVAAFAALAQAAGLEDIEIRNLIRSYGELQAARAAAIAEQAAINAEAASAQDVRARFGQAAASGLANEWIDHIASFANDPAFQLDLMRAFLATLPSMDTGGVVPGSFGQPTPIMAHGGELIGYPNMMAANFAGSSGGGPSAGDTYNATVNNYREDFGVAEMGRALTLAKLSR